MKVIHTWIGIGTYRSVERVFSRFKEHWSLSSDYESMNSNDRQRYYVPIFVCLEINSRRNWFHIIFSIEENIESFQRPSREFPGRIDGAKCTAALFCKDASIMTFN